MRDELEEGPARAAHVGPWLDRYRTGELPERERAAVAAHLAACPPCASELEELRLFADGVSRGFRAAVSSAARPEAHWAAQRRAILERTAVRPGTGRMPWLRLAPGAALAALALVAVGVIWRAGVRSPEEAEQRLSSRPEFTLDGSADGADERARQGEPKRVTGVGPEEEGRAPAADLDDRFGMARPPPPAELDTRERPGAGATDAPGALADKAAATPTDDAAPPPAAAGARAEPAREGITGGVAEEEGVADPPERANARRRTPDPATDREAGNGVVAQRADEAEGAARDGKVAGADAEEVDVLAKRKPEAEPLEQAGAAGGVAAPAVAVTPADRLRFEDDARGALATRDSARAERALALWRDTLALGAMSQEEERRGRTLADSLRAMLRR